MKIDRNSLALTMDMLGWKDYSYLPFIDRNYDAYFLNGFYAYGTNYYIVVKGQLPIKKAISLFEIAESKLLIRAGGHCEHIHPSSLQLQNKKLEKFWKDISKDKTISQLLKSNKELDSLYNEKKDKLMKSNCDDFYVDTYHIDTLEGFMFFTNFIKKNKIVSSWFD